jgi:hypothetical protein
VPCFFVRSWRRRSLHTVPPELGVSRGQHFSRAVQLLREPPAVCRPPHRGHPTRGGSAGRQRVAGVVIAAGGSGTPVRATRAAGLSARVERGRQVAQVVAQVAVALNSSADFARLQPYLHQAGCLAPKRGAPVQRASARGGSAEAAFQLRAPEILVLRRDPVQSRRPFTSRPPRHLPPCTPHTPIALSPLVPRAQTEARVLSPRACPRSPRRSSLRGVPLRLWTIDTAAAATRRAPLLRVASAEPAGFRPRLRSRCCATR